MRKFTLQFSLFAILLASALALGLQAAGQSAVSTQPVVAATPAPASSAGISAASDAVAIHYKGVWSAGTHVTESYDFLDFGKLKTNRLYLEGHELLAPGPGLSIYAGGLKLEPDLKSLFAKTNMQAENFDLAFSAAVGNGIPNVGGSHVSFIGGVGVKYRLNDSLSWQALQADYAQFGNTRFPVISTGLSFIFAKPQ